VFVNKLITTVLSEEMSEIKFKKPRRIVERKTAVEEDSDEDKSDDESLKLVLMNVLLFS